MSHFSVLVIGPNVEEQLQPYHEFECTGTDDQYIQEIDNTEEARAEFEKATTTRYKDPEGNLHNPFTPEGNWDSKFWRELTPEEEAKFGTRGFFQDYDEREHGVRLYSTDWHDGLPYHTKAFAFPSEGWSEVEVLKKDVESFAEFCEDYYGHKIVPFGEQPNTSEAGDDGHKYGYTLVDENGDVIKTVDRTNPNKKWDWYSVGGRWNGYFKLKPLAVGVLGRAGLQTMNSDYEPPTDDRADILMKGDIDIEGMRDEAGEEAADRYDRFTAITAGLPAPLTWKQMQEKHRKDDEVDEDGDVKHVDWDAARKEFHEQPMVKALRDSKDKDAIWWEVEDFLCPREQYIQRYRDGALATFAVVKDGKWYERGNMGWWGMVSNEKDRSEWYSQFAALIDGLPDDTILTVVDCHI